MITDWIIELVPMKDPEWDGHGTIDVLQGEEQDAVDQLEFFALCIQRTGHVPRSMDWQNESLAAVIRRKGRFSFQVRVDSFERETDSGMTSGAGWLRARSIPIEGAA